MRLKNKDVDTEMQMTGSAIYYRLIALWALCEAMLGGIIHGLRIPVSGLLVGSCAVVCISLLAWYVPGRTAILKATIIVAIFKMMLSPHAPLPAYVAVFFQGLTGALFFNNRKHFRLSCIVFATLALLESGLQRILILTIIYGNELWKVINDFINGLTKQEIPLNYSLLLAGAYVFLHLITGIVLGAWLSSLPGRIDAWSQDPIFLKGRKGQVSPIPVKKKTMKVGLIVVWLLLTGLYVQSYYAIGTPVLPANSALKILLRSLIIVLAWVLLISPLLKQLLHGWLKKKRTRLHQDIQQVTTLLPKFQAIFNYAWSVSSHKSGINRFMLFGKLVLASTLTENTGNSTLTHRVSDIYILSAPVQKGKTTSLVRWAKLREDVYGIATPLMNGKRVFMNMQTKECFPMEADATEKDVLAIGRFVFSKAGFAKAIDILNSAKNLPGWLVIDEIGPLELKGEGFYHVLNELVAERTGKILIVVRSGILKEVKEVFKIENAIEIQDISPLQDQ